MGLDRSGRDAGYTSLLGNTLHHAVPVATLQILKRDRAPSGGTRCYTVQCVQLDTFSNQSLYKLQDSLTPSSNHGAYHFILPIHPDCCSDSNLDEIQRHSTVDYLSRGNSAIQPFALTNFFSVSCKSAMAWSLAIFSSSTS